MVGGRSGLREGGAEGTSRGNRSEKWGPRAPGGVTRRGVAGRGQREKGPLRKGLRSRCGDPCACEFR